MYFTRRIVNENVMLCDEVFYIPIDNLYLFIIFKEDYYV